jgi:hypothetical protein
MVYFAVGIYRHGSSVDYFFRPYSREKIIEDFIIFFTTTAIMVALLVIRALTASLCI